MALASPLNVDFLPQLPDSDQETGVQRSNNGTHHLSRSPSLASVRKTLASDASDYSLILLAIRSGQGKKMYEWRNGSRLILFYRITVNKNQTQNQYSGL